MKHFPLKTMLLCLLLPPLLYTISLNFLEGHFERLYQPKIKQAVLAGSDSLLTGTVRFEDAVDEKIDAFLEKQLLIEPLGLDLDIRISADGGEIIFPPSARVNPYPLENRETWDSVKIAQDNYAILNQGISVRVIARIGHGTPLAIMVFAVYLLVSLAVFLAAYKRFSRITHRETTAKGEKIASLQQHEKNYQRMLSELVKERSDLFESLKNIKDRHDEDKEKASITEEEMFDEIEHLEKQLNANIQSQQEKEKEILMLKDELKKHERRKTGGSKRRQFDLAVKRFATLYKNVDMNRKALTSFFDLKDEQQIKAEEVVHQLNADADAVTVKRKVFTGKKNKTACFEVLFAYNGRLYFRKIEGSRIEVLLVGTKNSQDKDMEFLHNL